MRQKIINFIYLHKCFNWLLWIFYRIIGKNRFKGFNKSNKVSISNSNLVKNTIQSNKGCIDNRIDLGEKTFLSNSNILIKGSHNRIKIGTNGFINGLELVLEGDDNKIIIGDDAFILNTTRIYVVDGSKYEMGKGCMFSDNIEIRTTDNHSIIDMKTGERINYEKDVILHDKVWLGTGVTLLKGTELAEGCIVGAKSVVAKKYLKPNTIIVGNPSKEIKSDVQWKMERI